MTAVPGTGAATALPLAQHDAILLAAYPGIRIAASVPEPSMLLTAYAL